MSSRKVRLVVSTSTNFRFLTALPADISVKVALPALLNRYKAVVKQNIGAQSGLLQGITVEQITRGGCLIGREQIIGEILTDNDQVQIKLNTKEHHHDRNGQTTSEASKRQKLENKKKEKQANEKHAQQNQKGTQKPASKKVVPGKQKSESAAKQQSKTPEEIKKADLASKLLTKFRATQGPKYVPKSPKQTIPKSPSQPVAASKPQAKRVTVIEDQSS